MRGPFLSYSSLGSSFISLQSGWGAGTTAAVLLGRSLRRPSSSTSSIGTNQSSSSSTTSSINNNGVLLPISLLKNDRASTSSLSSSRSACLKSSSSSSSSSGSALQRSPAIITHPSSFSSLPSLGGGGQRGQQHQHQPRSFSVLKRRERLTVVVDMDECLLHSRFEEDMRDERGRDLAHQLLPNGDSESFHYQHQKEIGEALGDVRHRSVDYFWLELEEGERVRVNLRPKVEEFLQRLSDEHDVFIFTAATETYASPVLDRLDPTGSLIRGRFYRPSCLFKKGMYLKDLRRIQEGIKKQTLQRVVLVDNNPISFVTQPDNGIPVPNFYDDVNDMALPLVNELIDEKLSGVEDVRPVLRELFGLEAQLGKVRRQLLGEDEDERERRERKREEREEMQ